MTQKEANKFYQKLYFSNEELHGDPTMEAMMQFMRSERLNNRLIDVDLSLSRHTGWYRDWRAVGELVQEFNDRKIGR